MASMTCHYYSSTLGNNIAINVIIPTPQGNEQIVDQDIQKQYQYETGLPVVYLLHGAYGDFSSWIRYSNIERYAQERCCAVVMASAGNYFYQDMYRGSAYRTFFTEELPMFITSVFPVSKKGKTPTLPGSPWAATEPGTWPCQHPICMQKLPACPVRLTLRFYIGRHRMDPLITHFHGMISSRTRKRFPAVTGICSHCMNSAGKTIRSPACIRPAGPGISYMI